MPRSLKWGVIGGVSVLCAGATYIMIVRGPAILLDLAGAIAACFRQQGFIVCRGYDVSGDA